MNMVRKCEEDPANAPFYLLSSLSHAPEFNGCQELLEHLRALDSRGMAEVDGAEFLFAERLGELWRAEYTEISGLVHEADKRFAHAHEVDVKAERLSRYRLDPRKTWIPTIESLGEVVVAIRDLRADIRKEMRRLL